MKLVTNVTVNRVVAEGLIDMVSLMDFDKDSIEALPKACVRAIPAVEADPGNEIVAAQAVAAGNVSIASVQRLIVAADCARFYRDVGRTPTIARMNYANILVNFKTDFEAYTNLKRQDAPDIPLVNDKDREKKIIKWVPLFKDVMSRTFGVKGPLMYVLRDVAAVPDDDDDPLADGAYYGAAAGSLLEELVRRLPHTGPTYRDDNKTVYMAIATAVAGTSVETTIKSFSRAKDGRAAFLALIANHAGDIKYRSIVKSRMNMLTNVKWNGRSYPLETHISNHRSAVDDLRDCSTHVQNQVPNVAQRVEYLLDSISCQDSALQAAIGNIRANSNDLRTNFESAAAHMMEVDPYKRAVKNANRNGRNAQVSDTRFTAGRGETGVDLRWHPKKEFLALPDDQKDELTNWQATSEGKKAMRADKKRRAASGDNDNDKSKKEKSKNGQSWKKKLKKALKTPEGLAHVMSVMAEEETSNAAVVASLASTNQPPLPPAPATNPPPPPPATSDGNVGSVSTSFPNLATKVKLTSILKNGRK